MPAGPGKYDKECSATRKETGGSVCLIVIDGKKGQGFEVQAELHVIARLPQVLRILADEIEKSQRAVMS